MSYSLDGAMVRTAMRNEQLHGRKIQCTYLDTMMEGRLVQMVLQVWTKTMRLVTLSTYR